MDIRFGNGKYRLTHDKRQFILGADPVTMKDGTVRWQAQSYFHDFAALVRYCWMLKLTNQEIRTLDRMAKQWEEIPEELADDLKPALKKKRSRTTKKRTPK